MIAAAAPHWVPPPLLVELNTWLLLVRRHLPRHWALELLFFSTWVIFRALVPSCVLVAVLRDTDATYLSRKGVAVYLALMALQLKLTVDLVRKTLR